MVKPPPPARGHGRKNGSPVQWERVDVYRLNDGKISNIWAGDDWTAILNDTGTFKAPWIP